MQVALDDENISPLNATLESVMPGVHQRFMVMEGHVKSLDRGMISRFDKLEIMVQDSFKALQDYNRERDDRLADHHLMMAARLVSPGSTFTLANKSRRQAQESPTSDDDDAESSPSPTKNHRMVLKHHSIRSLWNEWYGLGEYEGKPMVGGISAIETLKKSKWRIHFSSSEKKQFSRSQIVIRAIIMTIEDSDETLESAINTFEVTYEADAKYSIAKMATIVQNLGLVTRKKARGRTQK